MTRARVFCLLLLACPAVACARGVPDTHYYVLLPQGEAPAAVGGEVSQRRESPRAEQNPVLAVEELSVDVAYDDPRIVYRTTPYRLEYYHYHRWSAPPGRLVSDFLRSGYAGTGWFERVERGVDEQAAVVLGGRVLAIEEVDRTPTDWVGRLDLELELSDAASREVVWSTRVSEVEPLDERSPEALARALSTAMARVIERTAPQIAEAARQALEKQRKREGEPGGTGP